MRKILIAAMAAATVAASTMSFVSAQTPVERRVQQNLRQAERQAQRAVNRSNYYTDNSWKQVSPWVTKYNLQTNRRIANAVNNVAQATNNAARAANNAARANARFGFTNPNANAQANWFYDYYQMPPTYFSTREGSTDQYSSAARYRDTNNDGIYDGLYSYRDSDNDGVYDEYDRIDFAESDTAVSKDTEKAESKDLDDDSIYDAHRHMVQGTVEASKEAKVNGEMHTVVRIKGEKDSLIVDLGSTADLKNFKVQEGTEISASGPMMQVGEKQVLVADKVTIENKEVVIARSSPRMVGTILETTSASAQDSEHVMVVVKTEQGNQLIDLGAADQLKVKLEPQTEIVFWGSPVQMRDHSVVLAEKVEFNGKTYSIKRW